MDKNKMAVNEIKPPLKKQILLKLNVMLSEK